MLINDFITNGSILVDECFINEFLNDIKSLNLNLNVDMISFSTYKVTIL